MKRSYLKRRTPMRRKKAQTAPWVLARRKERKASEFARKYHSEEYVEFVHRQRCCVALYSQTCSGTIEFSHNDSHAGTGRKGGYVHGVPMCRGHHVEYDSVKQFALDYPGLDLTAVAASTLAAFLS